jgi:hypothetical protein
VKSLPGAARFSFPATSGSNQTIGSYLYGTSTSSTNKVPARIVFDVDMIVHSCTNVGNGVELLSVVTRQDMTVTPAKILTAYGFLNMNGAYQLVEVNSGTRIVHNLTTNIVENSWTHVNVDLNFQTWTVAVKYGVGAQAVSVLAAGDAGMPTLQMYTPDTSAFAHVGAATLTPASAGCDVSYDNVIWDVYVPIN